jgi:hypothetical protein
MPAAAEVIPAQLVGHHEQDVADTHDGPIPRQCASTRRPRPRPAESRARIRPPAVAESPLAPDPPAASRPRRHAAR